MTENQAPDFDALLDKQVDDIKPPAQWPSGSYVVHILSREYIASREKKTPGLRIIHKFVEAKEDVDASQLEEALRGKTIIEREIRNDLWLTEASAFMVKDLIKACGINSTGRTLREAIDMLPGKNVGINVVQVPSTKPGDDRTFANISAYFAV